MTFKGVAFILLPLHLLCQQPVNDNFIFLEHLAATRQYNEAIFLLHEASNNLGKDTTSFLLGYNHHFMKRPDSATYYLNQVPIQSSFSTQAKFLQSLNILYDKKTNAYKALENLPTNTLEKYNQPYYLIKSACFLLERNYTAFDSIVEKFTYDNFNYSSEQKHLLHIKKDLLLQKKKSPALAGVLSAVVPGLGKFYAGKRGAALSAFITNMALAAVTYESYYRAGYKSPQFIVFGALFSFFYSGNIVGSVYSVKQQMRSFNGKINNEITATVHISIDRLFAR